MALLAAGPLLGFCCAGCGKTDLVSTPSASDTAAQPSERSPGAPRRPGAPRSHTTIHAATPPPKLTHRPSALQAATFSRAVNLQLVDLPGARAGKHSPDRRRAREAAECDKSVPGGIGGSESQRFTRGEGLAREVISSAVAVLGSESLAQRDLATVTSKTGIACYAKLVRHTLGREEHGLRLTRLRVGRLRVPLSGSGEGLGLRVSARITELKSGASIPLFIDALVTLHQSAELELYASSYVQPEPTRTEQELLELMQQRALLSKL